MYKISNSHNMKQYYLKKSFREVLTHEEDDFQGKHLRTNEEKIYRGTSEPYPFPNPYHPTIFEVFKMR